MVRISLKNKANNGITLIALVITIIVLLILAGVTIATLMGDNGILTKATEARDKTKTAEEEEKVRLAVAGALAEDNGDDIRQESLEDELANYFADEDYDVAVSSNEAGEEGYLVTVTENNAEGNTYFVSKDGNTSVQEKASIMATLKIEGEEATGDPTIPSGFSHVDGTTVEDGYVIKDASGNEFVWVPVDKNQKIKINVTSEQNIESVVLTAPSGVDIITESSLGTSYNKEDVEPKINGVYKLTVTAGGETKEVELDVYSLYAIRMWELDTLTEEVAQINGYTSLNEYISDWWGFSSLEEAQEFIKSWYRPGGYEEKEFYEDQVKANGGFYIGRYEASYENGNVASKLSTSIRTSSSTSLENGMLWNYISQTDAITNVKSTFQGNNYTSSLLTGSAWDRTLCWLYETGEKSIMDIVGDSKDWGNYSDDTFSETNGLIDTGSEPETRANNIYDLAGNLEEWTSEANNTGSRVVRGRLLQL